jgi:hypothetical protein
MASTREGGGVKIMSVVDRAPAAEPMVDAAPGCEGISLDHAVGALDRHLKPKDQ